MPIPETKEDNTTGPQASPNKIKQAAKPSDNRMMGGVRKRVEKKDGLDLANVPKKLRLEGRPVHPIASSGKGFGKEEIDKSIKGSAKPPIKNVE